jgi:hypothetical protein
MDEIAASARNAPRSRARWRRRLPGASVLADGESLKPYECDGLSAYRQTPLVAAIPGGEAEVAAVLAVARATRTPVVARGSGTGLSGGALPLADGILLSMARFDKVVAIDPLARTARVQPGVRNLRISESVAHLGPLLRARPVEPDRVLDRRQRRREFRRRALPQVRPHGAQHPQGARDDDRGRRRRARLGARSTRPATTCSRW